MLINTIANELRIRNGEPLTLEMLEAELKEVQTLRPINVRGRIDKQNHVAALKAAINFKKNKPCQNS